MSINKQIEYWLKASEIDWETTNNLFSSGMNFHLCLFMGHLTLEKLFKALVLKVTETIPPKTHNLLRLAELAKLNLTTDDIKFLEELNQFQLETRYPDEKFLLYKTATKEFTDNKIKKVKEFREWLMQKI